MVNAQVHAPAPFAPGSLLASIRIAFGTEPRALVSIMQICFSPLSKETYLNYHLLCFNENGRVLLFFLSSPTSCLRSARRRVVFMIIIHSYEHTSDEKGLKFRFSAVNQFHCPAEINNMSDALKMNTHFFFRFTPALLSPVALSSLVRLVANRCDTHTNGDNI